METTKYVIIRKNGETIYSGKEDKTGELIPRGHTWISDSSDMYEILEMHYNKESGVLSLAQSKNVSRDNDGTIYHDIFSIVELSKEDLEAILDKTLFAKSE